MNKKYDIVKVGRRMPYKVGDKFFDDLERDLSTELGIAVCAAPQKRNHVFKIASIATLGAAACIILFLLFKPAENSSVDIQNIKQAYASLSEEDQVFLMEVYYDDVFLHQQ